MMVCPLETESTCKHRKLDWVRRVDTPGPCLAVGPGPGPFR